MADELRYGNCGDCRFTLPITKGHRHSPYYRLWCVRFPPVPAAPSDIWTANTPVSEKDGCWEFKEKLNGK